VRSLLLVLLVALPGLSSLTRIRDRNQAVQQAQAAYSHGDFAQAAQHYRRAVDKLGAREEPILLNLGHAYARAGQAAEARAAYGRLLTSPTAVVRSVARQQLAVLAAQKGEYAQAVGLLRQALLADPTNSAARYNYEVLHDYLARRSNEPKMPPPASPANSDAKSGDSPSTAQQPQPKPGQDRTGQLDDPTQPEAPRHAAQKRADQAGQRDPSRPTPGAGTQAGENFQPGTGPQQRVAQGAQPGNTRGLSTTETDLPPTGAPSHAGGSEQASLNETQLQTQRERLQQMNLSSGQARQLLDALRTAEEQYLQQMPRRATKKPDPKKPTW
jgi:tetratricopeptide (TPR) repeat protein